MNKKILMFALPILAIGLVAAGILGYYAMFSATFTVNSAFTIEGELEQNLSDVYSGGITEGEPINFTNVAPSSRTISFESDSGECDIETSYATTLELNKKTLSGDWEIIPDTTIVLTYTVVGNEFKYKVDNGTQDLTGYVVVYYPDLDGNPGSWNIDNAKHVGNADTEWTSSSIEVLPDVEDWNTKAKLWVIPETDWNAKSWNPTEWYFENNLITYGDDVTIGTNESITIIPLYDIAGGVEGECTVTTEVI